MDPLESKHDWTKMPNLMSHLSEGVSLASGAIAEREYIYGITINILPIKLINRRKWKDYDNEKQKSILERILQKLFRENPSIRCIERNYELCPKLKNIHVHMLVQCASEWISHIEAYINRVCHIPDHEYRCIDIIKLPTLLDKSQWLQYIRKAIV